MSDGRVTTRSRAFTVDEAPLDDVSAFVAWAIEQMTHDRKQRMLLLTHDGMFVNMWREGLVEFIAPDCRESRRRLFVPERRGLHLRLPWTVVQLRVAMKEAVA